MCENTKESELSEKWMKANVGKWLHAKCSSGTHLFRRFYTKKDGKLAEQSFNVRAFSNGKAKPMKTSADQDFKIDLKMPVFAHVEVPFENIKTTLKHVLQMYRPIQVN